MEWNKNGFTITTDKSLIHLATVHNFLSHSYWAENITLEVVKRSIEGSLCLSILKNGQQVGFARVITDKATFAYLADVFVLEEYRGQGLSKWLMEVIMSVPELQGLRRFLLATKDAHGLYSQFGFEPLNLPDRWMQVHKPFVYKQS